MKITLLAVGRLGRSPEALLARDYVQRAAAGGRALGLHPIDLAEVESRKPGKAAEGEVLLAHAQDAHLIVCDEHAPAPTSRALAERIGRLRDDGLRQLTFVIGGADGLSDTVLAPGREAIGFGPQTWPHALARVMLAEQIYRAVTLLAGGPYHRD